MYHTCDRAVLACDERAVQTQRAVTTPSDSLFRRMQIQITKMLVHRMQFRPRCLIIITCYCTSGCTSDFCVRAGTTAHFVWIIHWWAAIAKLTVCGDGEYKYLLMDDVSTTAVCPTTRFWIPSVDKGHRKAVKSLSCYTREFNPPGYACTGTCTCNKSPIANIGFGKLRYS